ncbi:MAG: zinc metalloprotease HtpX [Candidatus Aenigmarchaeota archaeon]|nr:zinc metalloprotease HtpX [Candidatus Aenigmarchaeota archaeon]
MSSIFRTLIPLTILTVLFLAVGYYFAGSAGMALGFIMALGANLLAYWYSDKFVLMAYGAKKVKSNDYPEVYASLEKIAKKANIPVPPLYYVNVDVPNAFATGRDPEHAAVAVTKGLLAHLNTEEVEAVLAHEIGHVKNRDTLISAMAATLAGAITWFAHMFIFSSNEDRSAASYLLLLIVAPLAATILQLAISRGREFEADKFGAHMSDPLDLASALEKISAAATAQPAKGDPSMSALFIVNPFAPDFLARLFSTHPPVEERISVLRHMSV